MPAGRPARETSAVPRRARAPLAPHGNVPSRSVPERRLLLAILSDAIVVLRGDPAGRRRVNRRDLEATLRWVRSVDRRSPCSFVNICDALGLAHEPLRRALLAPPTKQNERRATRRRLLAGRAL